MCSWDEKGNITIKQKNELVDALKDKGYTLYPHCTYPALKKDVGFGYIVIQFWPYAKSNDGYKEIFAKINLNLTVDYYGTKLSEIPHHATTSVTVLKRTKNIADVDIEKIEANANRVIELYSKFCADLKEADETACENLK